MLSYDRLVVGGNLTAIEYAHQNNLPIVFAASKPPFYFDPEIKNWNQKLFTLGLAGLHPLADRASTLRVEDEHTLKAIVGSREQRIKFKKLIVFDDEDLTGLPVPKKKIKKCLVLDWMTPKSCTAHDIEGLTSNSDFVKEIIFYPERCHSGRALLVKSVIRREKLESYEYSATYARFKAEKMMKDAGLIGKRNGDYHLLLKSVKREIKQYKMPEYEDTETIKFIYNSDPKSVIIESGVGFYLNKLKSYFGKRASE
jgi:hypothetical protein